MSGKITPIFFPDDLPSGHVPHNENEKTCWKFVQEKISFARPVCLTLICWIGYGHFLPILAWWHVGSVEKNTCFNALIVVETCVYWTIMSRLYFQPKKHLKCTESDEWKWSSWSKLSPLLVKFMTRKKAFQKKEQSWRQTATKSKPFQKWQWFWLVALFYLPPHCQIKIQFWTSFIEDFFQGFGFKSLGKQPHVQLPSHQYWW